jgi:UDP-N-acetyl-D-glucosamine dehydrogenase
LKNKNLQDMEEQGGTLTKDTSKSSVCVIGLGKLGLPLALQFALNDTQAWGFDIDETLISRLRDGESPFNEPGLTEHLPQLIESSAFNPTSDLAQAMTAVTHVIFVVPLDIDSDGKPDFRKLDAATTAVSKFLRAGQTVIFETTIPVGTTRNRLGPILEAGSGLKAGQDFHLAFSPERVSSGTMKMGFGQYPKLVGGVNEESTKRAAQLYAQGFRFVQNPSISREVGVWEMGSSEAAEFSKLAETTYRDVNLALANTFALASMKHGVDYMEVVEACNSQPFSHLHSPGIAIGGHCIPVYPHLFLSSNDGLGLVESARSVNDSVPNRMVIEAQRLSPTKPGSKALIIGLCYRTGVRESAHSGAFQLKDSLLAAGISVALTDDLFSEKELTEHGFNLMVPGESYDYVFINAGEESFVRQVIDDIPGKPLVVDGRRTLTANPPTNYIKL